MINKKEANIFVDNFKEVIYPFIGKKLELVFSIHNFTVHLLDVSLAFAYEQKSLIDQREEDGKNYTPGSMKLSFEEGNLFFVIEDIVNYSVGINNFIIEMQEGFLVEWRLIHDNNE